MITKTLPGPHFKIDNSLPCGCRIARDNDTKRLRLWYCPTHAAAFEVLEALRLSVDGATDADVRARTAIRRATVGVA
jgi:hypothetical protein